jgi:MoaA/NifB/PqqE/SkfB family radical SAM enzyme
MGFVANYVRNLAGLAALREPRRPLLFSYYVTHRCPLACRYCGDGQGRPFSQGPVAELPTAEAKRLISLLRADCDTLDITGGEPMLRPDLEDLLAHARQAGFRTVLNTKGLGLSRRPDVARLSDALVLSVDSLQADRLAATIGAPPTMAAEIIETLHWVLGNRERIAARVVLSAVATPDNLDDVGEVLRLCVKQGLGFQLSPQIVGTAVHSKLGDDPRFRSLMDEVIAAKAGGAGVLGAFRYLRGIRDLRPYRCHPLLMPTIRPDGAVNLPCLERPAERVDLLAAGGYRRAIARAIDRKSVV